MLRDLKRLEPSALELLQRLRSSHEMQRRALLRSRLGERQLAVGKLECREDVAWHPLRWFEPVQPTRNHEMHDDVQIVVYARDDPLAEPADRANGLVGHAVQGRVYRAQQKWRVQVEHDDRLADDAAFEGLDVDSDVRQLGHAIEYRGLAVRGP